MFGVRKQRLDVRKDSLAHIGQRHTTAGAVEQARVAFALEGIQVPAQQRLVAVEKEGCARQAAEFGNGQKGAPFLQVGGEIELELGGFGGLHVGHHLEVPIVYWQPPSSVAGLQQAGRRLPLAQSALKVNSGLGSKGCARTYQLNQTDGLLAARGIQQILLALVDEHRRIAQLLHQLEDRAAA